MRRSLLLLVVLLAACTKHVPGELGTLRLSVVEPVGGGVFEQADQVEVRIVDPGRTSPFVQSMAWPPAAAETPLDFLLTPEGTQWSLVIAAKSDGVVVAVGHSSPFDVTPGPEIAVSVYVGAVNRFGTAPARLAQARSGHSAFTLPDGRVAVVGGAAEGDPASPVSLASAFELVDPLGRDPSGTKPGFGAGAVAPRTLHGAVLTGAGQVVVTGGLDAAGLPLGDLWVLEPGQPTSQHLVTGGMAARAGAAVALITGGNDAGKLLVAGGCDGPSLAACHPDAWVVDLNGFAEQRTGFGVVRFGATATPLPGHGDVLVAGGRDEAGLASAVYLFDSKSGAIRPVTSLLLPREKHVAVPLPDGSVLLCGGVDATGALASAEVFVPWLPPAGRMLPAGSLTVARHGAAAVALGDGSIVVVGGVDQDGAILPSVERFVPQGPNANADAYLGAFSTFAATLPDARTGAAAALGPGRELLVTGGLRASGAAADVLVFAHCLDDDGFGTACAPP